ncbi:MAG TPA: acyl-CoA dehydrogenase family protein, partial [Polyangiales bacterium]|nr:acyl-CoA dehydrogenase family protein [Polyangiales bacterium]
MTEPSAFRSELRAFLSDNVPEVLRGRPMLMPAEAAANPEPADIVAARAKYLSVMSQRGYTVPRWPKEYGGAGLTVDEARILQEELDALRLTPALLGMGVSMIGPTLLVHGSEEQKQRFLPLIASGAYRFCQGFSEPGAGSDLAALRTSAVLDASGQQYIINGSKIWTSGAQHANWIFMLVRTDTSNKHNGITFILVDMSMPGIEVKPIRLLSGHSMFCEVFFHDVVAQASDVVGQVNAGWTVAKTLLGFERSGMGAGAVGAGNAGRRGAANSSNELVTLAKQTVGEHEGMIADGAVRDAVAQLMLDELALSLTIERAAASRSATGAAGPEMSLFKLHQSELGQRRDELALSLRGSDALAWEGAGTSPQSTAATRMWLSAKATTIWGGTSEVQRNIIAKRILRLPS